MLRCSYWLSTQSGRNKYALDINIDKKYKNINYIKASALNIPFKDGKFNQVFAFDVIEHILKRTEGKFLSELIRVAKLWSEIILTVPSVDINILINWISKKWGHYKYNGLSEGKLKKYLDNRFNSISYKIIEN